MENEKKITILTQNNLDYLLSNSVRSLPANPTSAGYTAERIKEKQWLPAKILFEYLKSFQGNVSEAFVEAYENFTSLDEKIDNEALARANADGQLSALISTKEQSLLGKIAQEATTRGNADAALSARIDEAKANGYAKFDDLGNVIKDTYVKKTQIVNNVTSEGETEKPLGAGQGYVLQNQIDHILTLLASDESTLDTLQEIVDYIKTNKSLIDAITTSKVSVSDIIDNLTSEIANKPLSAKQGKVLKGLIDALQTVVNTLATKDELDEVKDELDSASVDVIDYSMGKVSGKDDGLALPEESQLELKALRGNSVAWNQLVDEWKISNVADSSRKNNVPITLSSSGTIDELAISATIGHKAITIFDYYCSSDFDGSVVYRNYIADTGNVSITDISTSVKRFALISEINRASNSINLTATITAGSVTFNNLHFIDLTDIYGAGNEPTLTTDPKAQWAINYALKHPSHDAGSLVSVDMSAYETEGFNQWDEEWELGVYNYATGQPTPNANYFRSKNPINVLPNEQYCFTHLANTEGQVFYYDANDNFISYSTIYERINIKTTPANCRFVRFFQKGTTYNHDICVNISDTSLNGTYKPSEKNTYPISFHGKSAGSAYDERKADGTDIVRVGSVDLGTLTWVYQSEYQRFTANLAGLKIAVGRSVEMICPLYVCLHNQEAFDSNWNNVVYNGVNESAIYIHNHSYTDPTAFKTAMSGVYLYYELATPVQSVNDPLPNAIKVYQNGTEWQINDGAPCGMAKDYDVSIKGQVITNVRVDARQEEEIKELWEKKPDPQDLENPNLLYNPDFAINTTGQTSWSGNDVPCIDGWNNYGGVSSPSYVSESDFASKGLKIVSSGTARIFQNLDNYTYLWGKTLTLSYCIDGVAYTFTGTMPTTIPTTSNGNVISSGYNTDGYRIRIGYYPSQPRMSVILDCNVAKTYIVNWVKLEFGSFATKFVPTTYKQNILSQNEFDFVTSEYEKTLNLWDEQWESGSLNTSTGAKESNFRTIRSKNYIPVSPSTNYCFTKPDVGVVVCFYADDFTYINYIDPDGNEITTPSNARYILFRMSSDYGTTYNYDIIIAEGDTALPYQPYNGKVMHAIDVEGVKLWENGSPNSAFSQTTISVADMSAFREIVVIYKYYFSNCTPTHFKFGYSIGTNGFVSNANQEGNEVASRRFVLTSATQIQIKDAWLNGSSNNDVIIPLAIYGIK